MADQVSRMASGGVVGVLHAVADELLAVVSRAAKRDKVDMWIPVKFDFLSSLGHVTWRVLAAALSAGLLEKWDPTATSRYVVEPLWSKKQGPCAHVPLGRSPHE